MADKSLNRLFGLAVQKKAEKLIITPSKDELNCFYKLPYGEEAYFKLPKKLENDLGNNLRALLKLAPEDLMDGKYCKIKNKNYQLNFYLSIIPDHFGEKIIINILKDKKKLLSLSKLGLNVTQKEIIKKSLLKKGGLIVISSPERQGRSTTLFSLLKEIDREKRDVYFLGKYPDLEIEGLNYLAEDQINWDWVMHHDTDVLALDSENEIDLGRAVLAANTGRLVLITLKAVNSFEALFKLLTLDLPKKLILDNLLMICGQKLKTLNRPKKKKTTSAKERREKIGQFEILHLNKKVKNYILENSQNIRTKEFWRTLISLIKENT